MEGWIDGCFLQQQRNKASFVSSCSLGGSLYKWFIEDMVNVFVGV